MAERKPLVNVSGVVNEISGSDTIPVANYPTMVGDSGSGGTKGAVPAPASGDAAANKFLKANGTWAAPSGGSSPLTTKGDVYTYSTVDARLPVGTDGDVLSASSGDTTGLKYAPPVRMVVSTAFETSGRFTAPAVGGGSATYGTEGVVLNTSATGGGRVSVDLETQNTYDFAGRNSSVSFIATMQGIGTDLDLFMGMGKPTVAAGSITFTNSHYGFTQEIRASAKTTYASNANGTTQTKTSFTNPGNSTDMLFSAVKVGTSSIRFYVDGTLAATHTTNIPTTFTGQRLAVTNRSTATQSLLRVHAMSVTQDIL